MKYFVAFAFLAVASAMAEVEPLKIARAVIPEFHKPDISPAMVPQEVMDAVRMAEAAEADPELLKVKIVEFAEEVAPSDEGLTVKVVDAPLESTNEAENFAVNFVDAPLEVLDQNILEAIKVAAPRPGKQYADPTWR